MIKKISFFLFVVMLIPTFHALANSDSDIVIDMEYILVNPLEDEAIEITDMVSYKNQTTEEYKGDGSTDGVISVLLPTGATELSFKDANLGYKETDTGFLILDSIPANSSLTVSYSYKLKQVKDFSLTFNYPLTQYQILLPEGAGSIEVDGAEAINQGVIPFDSQNYWVYSIENLQLNQTVGITYNKDIQPTVSTENQGGQTSNNNNTTNNNLGNVTKTAPDFHNPGHLRMWAQSPLRKFDPHILMIVLGAILFAGIGYFIFFKWKNNVNTKTDSSEKEERLFQQLMAKQQAILDKILELEEKSQNGTISEAEYQSKLEAYKQHLVQVKLSLRQFVE